MPGQPGGEKLPASLNSCSSKEKVHHLKQTIKKSAMGNSMFKTKDGLFNKAQITNEIREAKRHGPGKVKTFI